jgi:hypothetical protein
MTKLEYSDFYKFLVSLGVVLIALALLVPWLFLRESFDALLTVSEMSELTPAAQTLISYRQYAALWFVSNVLWISLSLVLGGLVPLVMGLTLWVKKQRRLDQQEKYEVEITGLELEKLKRELEPMTPAEIAVRGIEEVEEEVTGKPDVSTLPSRVHRYLHIENMFLRKLITCYGENRALPHQMIRARGRSSEYDAILLSEYDQSADIIFEIKHFTQQPQLNGIRMTVQRLIESIEVYAAAAERKAIAIIFFVLSQDMLNNVIVDKIVWTIKDQAEQHNLLIHPIFITEQELEALSCDDLRAKILNVEKRLYLHLT